MSKIYPVRVIMEKQLPPSRLENHKKTQTFNLNDDVFHLYDHLAYFHDKEFPLYMHSHDFYELNIIVQGHGRHYIEDKNFSAEPGDVFAIPPHVRHGYWAENNQMSIFHLLIGEYMFAKYDNMFGQFSGVKLLFETEPMIRRTSDKLSLFLHLNKQQQANYYSTMQDLIHLSSATYSGARALFELRSVCLICELAHLISSDYDAKRTEEHSPNTAYAIIPTAEYMNENLEQHITLNDLAKQAMISPSSYLRHFKKLFGLTPIEYLIRQRATRAAKMLAETEKPITTIAQDCGFFDCSHMTRVFKQVYGLTPSEYRKNNKP